MEQNLLSFVSKTREELKEFQEEWLSKHELDPESFPLDMSEGDWFEQYISWVTG